MRHVSIMCSDDTQQPAWRDLSPATWGNEARTPPHKVASNLPGSGGSGSQEGHIEHFGPGCTCDRGGEDPRCPHHGYEAVIRRLQGETHALREFAAKMWLELDDAADAVGPVPDLVERNLRHWSHEAWELLEEFSPSRLDQEGTP